VRVCVLHLSQPFLLRYRINIREMHVIPGRGVM